MSPKISVIMTSYNKARWISQSIQSVVDQTYQDWELIIVDDNSSDTVVKKIIDSYAAYDDRIITHFTEVTEAERYKKARYAHNINLAVKEYASGEYITYVTDDDYYYPQRLDAYMRFFEANPDVSVAYSAQHVVDAEGKESGMRKTQGLLDNAWNKIDHNSIMHKRELFDKVGGWYAERGAWGGADAYFFRKLNEAGEVFHPVSEHVALEAKRYHEDSVQWQIANKCFFPEDRHG